MSKYPYTVEKQVDGNFLIQFLDFPTGSTESHTLAGVAVAAKEVLEGLVEAYNEEGLVVPKASYVGSMRFVEI
jgi:predicted RNase H-like HicB family nuclease